MGKTCEAKDYGRYWGTVETAALDRIDADANRCAGTMNFLNSFSLLISIPLSGIMLEKMGAEALGGFLASVVFVGGSSYYVARSLILKKWFAFRAII